MVMGHVLNDAIGLLTVIKFADKIKLNKITLWHHHKQEDREKGQKVKRSICQIHISLLIFQVCCMWEKI